MAATSAVVAGPHDRQRPLRRGGERLVVGVVVADGVAGEEVPVADDVDQRGQVAQHAMGRHGG